MAIINFLYSIFDDFLNLLFQYGQFIRDNIPNDFHADGKILMNKDISESGNSVPFNRRISFSNISRNIPDCFPYHFEVSHHGIDSLFVSRKSL